ncbi:glycosyltransferase family 8 protein [Pectinatus frisingensis]|uniref:glycosyltransferase family 8 protein n=1 Tax=Pectinatus frisingensis TaxID=865 RepID=UPI0018C61776|nr:glycosyltransferase [Pectinatus frisingensis]
MNFFTDMIKAKKNIANKIDLSDSMNIAFGIDAHFALGMGVLMSSIIKNNPSATIAFHVFTDRLISDDISHLAALGRAHKNIAIYIYYINNNKFTAFPTLFTWSKAIYYRFIICRELSTVSKRCLYLDSDILCLNSLENLFKADFKNAIALVVPDHDGMTEYARRNFNFNGEKYFNSGVMLIDIRRWNEANISEQAVTLLQNKNNFKFYDQDVLNLLLVNKVLFLPVCYNTIYHLADMKNNVTSDTIFLHYSGSVKPWQRWGQFHQLTSLWHKYQKSSPWANVPVQEARTYKQAKFMARTMKRTGNYSGWLQWSTLYIIWRIRDKTIKAVQE